MIYPRSLTFKALGSLSLLLALSSTQAYGQTNILTSVSAANWLPITAPGSIVEGFSAGINSSNNPAATATVNITDSAGAVTAATVFGVYPGQISFMVPPNAALGRASVSAVSAGVTYQGPLLISNLAPGIFTANASGTGVPIAQVWRISRGVQTLDPTPFTLTSSGIVATPINLGPPSDQVYLVMYGTGFRRHSLNPVRASIGGVSVPVAFAGAQDPDGVDQVNIGPLPQSLASTGKGNVNIVVTVDGSPTNTTQLLFQ